MDLATSLPKQSTFDDDDTEEDSEAERWWYSQSNQVKQEEEDISAGDVYAEDKEHDVVDDKKDDLNLDHHPAAEVPPRPPWRLRSDAVLPAPPAASSSSSAPSAPSASSAPAAPAAPLRRAEPVRERASPADRRFYEMFGSRREYERLVRGKTRSRRGASYRHRQEQRRW